MFWRGILWIHHARIPPWTPERLVLALLLCCSAAGPSTANGEKSWVIPVSCHVEVGRPCRHYQTAWEHVMARKGGTKGRVSMAVGTWRLGLTRDGSRLCGMCMGSSGLAATSWRGVVGVCAPSACTRTAEEGRGEQTRVDSNGPKKRHVEGRWKRHPCTPSVASMGRKRPCSPPAATVTANICSWTGTPCRWVRQRVRRQMSEGCQLTRVPMYSVYLLYVCTSYIGAAVS